MTRDRDDNSPRMQPQGDRAILAAISELKELIMTLQDEITQLQADVAADTTVVNSAVTLINGIAAQIAAAVAAALAGRCNAGSVSGSHCSRYADHYE